MNKQKNILHLSKKDIEIKLIELGEKPFRAKQIWNWIYLKGIQNFDAMTDISKQFRSLLKENFVIDLPQVSKDLISIDGTRKFLVKFFDGNEVESVFIPEEDRATLCISSQVGCTLSCKFCHTGTQTWVRNLEWHEIVAQILLAKNLINDWDKNNKKLTNIVFMGMGEPFFNYDNVAKSIKIINDCDGLDISLKKITISTSGLIPEIIKSADEIKTNLAISLHATNDKARTEIMAINKKYPLKDLMNACVIYGKKNPNQTITFEYVMLKDFNDSKENALELVSMIKKFNLKVKINIIPFNSWSGCSYDRSNDDKIKIFQKILKDNKLISPIRKNRGNDVMAACGQLKSFSKRIKNHN